MLLFKQQKHLVFVLRLVVVKGTDDYNRKAARIVEKSPSPKLNVIETPGDFAWTPL